MLLQKECLNWLINYYGPFLSINNNLGLFWPADDYTVKSNRYESRTPKILEEADNTDATKLITNSAGVHK